MRKDASGHQPGKVRVDASAAFRYVPPLSRTHGEYMMSGQPTIVLSLEGRLPDVIDPAGCVRFLRAEWTAGSRCRLIRYAVDGVEVPLGLRMDIDKRVLLDRDISEANMIERAIWWAIQNG